ncbi:MAG: Fic family protein [Clostridiales bacterium]|nr:Fic family protein [Clostridiales bacterium]
MNAHKNGGILKVAACLHANFENIHPFADGNDRVGRTHYFVACALSVLIHLFKSSV